MKPERKQSKINWLLEYKWMKQKGVTGFKEVSQCKNEIVGMNM